ncbi:MAG: biotin--[acetyl-CoA-carboxylase] ligase [Saprospiraceae bacterium]|nr:biotin--[acetyl-CoA-carboxylase] ligase [Saprospiraceae bacterium]
MKLSKATYIGFPHLFLDEVDSTNAYALSLTSNSNPIEGTAISAGFQSSGRGQIGRSWWGEPGKNIFTSVILKPSHIQAADQWIINQSVSIAIVKCLEAWVDKPIKIKWPNDIYINDKKICGILIQCNLAGKNIQHAIIGIGLNVNQDQFPAELPNPTSLLEETDEEIDIIQLRNALYASLEEHYGKTKTFDAVSIRHQYQEYLYRKGLPTSFMKQGKSLIGTIMGVDEIGRLMLMINGRQEAFNFNEVKMIINKKIF